MFRLVRDVVLSIPVAITFNDCIASVARAESASLGAEEQSVVFPPATQGEGGITVPFLRKAGVGVSSAAGVPAARGGGDAAASTSSSLRHSYVLLDRTCARTISFARGDLVYLKSPSDHRHFTVQRLVALEGDWVTRRDSDDVEKVPKGHCWLESAERTSSSRGGGGGGGGGDGGIGEKGGGVGWFRNRIQRGENGEEVVVEAPGELAGGGWGGGMGYGLGSVATSGGGDLGAVPIALLDARVPVVLWPNLEVVRREVPPGRVLMQATWPGTSPSSSQ